MADLTCIDCGAPAHISDRDGAYCDTHWDERQAALHAEEKRATEAAGGPWPHLCPRRVEDGALDRYLDPSRQRETPDTWDIREQMHKGLRARHCSYCGSLHPDDFMRLVEEGWVVGATDKNYKAYLGSPDPGGSSMETKFYFQHLSAEQQIAFVEKPLNLGSSELISIDDLAALIANIAGVDISIRHKIDAPTGVAGRNSDNTLIQEVLGWEPSISLSAGLERTYRWVYDQVRHAGRR